MVMHFVKVFGMFVVMIALGLVGVYFVNIYGQEGAPQATVVGGCTGEEC